MEHPEDFGPPLDKIKLTHKEQRLIIHLEDHKRTQKPLLKFAVLTKQHWQLKKICEDMGFRVGVINGQVAVKDRNRIDLDFRAGLIDIVIASGATAGVGFN
jgi:superfamily II DNA/RNA helicase